MRIQVPFTSSIRIVDATLSAKGFLLQNLDANSRLYVSESQRDLDTVDSTGTPIAGLQLPVNMAAPVVVTRIVGALYARSGSPGPANVEVIVYDVDIHGQTDPKDVRRTFPYVSSATIPR